MTLKIIQSGNALPFAYPVDPTAEFQPGMIGQLYLYGNNIVMGVSDGTAPLGIIDDVKTTAFYRPAIDEVHIVPVVTSIIGGKYVTTVDTLAELENPNISINSFICDVPVYLRQRNGNVTIPAGTEANYDQDGDGIPDSVRIVCNYVYQVPGVPGDDSTAGSGRATIWFNRMIFETDQFEVSMRYPLNANLFVSEAGLLTTRKPSDYHFPVAMVLAPPTSRMSSLIGLYL